MTEYLTVDVGGTDIKYGVMTADGHLKESKKQSTPDNLAEIHTTYSVLDRSIL